MNKKVGNFIITNLSHICYFYLFYSVQFESSRWSKELAENGASQDQLRALVHSSVDLSDPAYPAVPSSNPKHTFYAFLFVVKFGNIFVRVLRKGQKQTKKRPGLAHLKKQNWCISAAAFSESRVSLALHSSLDWTLLLLLNSSQFFSK